jgi:hypothetical protein
MANAKPNQIILLYGNSILIERLTAKLRLTDEWEVKRIANGEVKDLEDVDCIVVDLCDSATSEALPMLCRLPGVRLIGMDALANTLTVLTGRTRPLRYTRDVLAVLKEAL